MCFMFLFANVSARTMKQFFVQTPLPLLPELSDDNRLDCIDYLASGMKATVKNRLGENSSLLKLNDRYALVELSSSSRCEMRLLVDGEDSLLCVVKTWLTPEPESTVRFYNTAWEEQPAAAHLTMPVLKDFEAAPEGEGRQNRLEVEKTGLVLISASLSETDDSLRFTVNCDDSDPDLRKELQPLLKVLTYEWRKGRFELFSH